MLEMAVRDLAVKRRDKEQSKIIMPNRSYSTPESLYHPLFSICLSFPTFFLPPKRSKRQTLSPACLLPPITPILPSSPLCRPSPPPPPPQPTPLPLPHILLLPLVALETRIFNLKAPTTHPTHKELPQPTASTHSFQVLCQASCHAEWSRRSASCSRRRTCWPWRATLRTRRRSSSCFCQRACSAPPRPSMSTFGPSSMNCPLNTLPAK
jgi:hypothetical protein